ncbi:hypothetical protein AKJ09_03670 [Labilithrix luteola]|uniref:Phage major capsid protein n=1 Tax=Labilithrix luteola TaxID=1391654 RepID=A0A0K1PUF8_9BACT|nr:hypothetical protein [Labilithrix luteola]AKU97006.1 hypothetical protein AKJ09_03670 [Labilithrix luteola]
MASSLDAAALGAVLKVQYNQKKVNNLCYRESSFFAKLKKNQKFGGKVEQVTFKYGNPQGRGAAFAVAQGNITTSVYDAVNVTRAKDYAFANIEGEMIDAAKDNEYALLDGLKSEIDGAFYTCARSIANSLFQAGGGARGKIGASTVLASTLLVLEDPNSVVNFEKGMVLNLSATDGTSGTKRTGTLTVVGVDRDAGTLTLNANISTVGSAIQGDYIFQNGDFETAKSMLTGLAGWIPFVAPAPGDNFFGLDRSSDPTRLAGIRFTQSSGGPYEETLIKCAARVDREGGRPDTVIMNPIDYGQLVVAMGSKVIIDNKQLPDADIGFRALQLNGPKGPMDVITDANCPSGYFYMLTMSTWEFKTLLGAPRILGETGDGLKLLRNPQSDSYQLRVGYYGNLLCDAPGWNAVGKL